MEKVLWHWYQTGESRDTTSLSSSGIMYNLNYNSYNYHTWYFHSLMTTAFWCQNTLRHFTRSALPLLYSWSDSPIRCSIRLYSWSGSMIGSAYHLMHTSFCFRFNKSLTNLTSLRQHHLQYIMLKLDFRLRQIGPGWNCLPWIKHLSLFGLFVSCKKKNMLWIQSLELYSQNFIFFVTYEWAQ